MISPLDARRRVANGSAVLVDIREPMEHAREAIPGAQLHSLSSLDPQTLAAISGPHGAAIIFHCQSGKRTGDNAERLRKCSAAEAYILQGGLLGWKDTGYPTSVDRTKPIDMQRQVQIAGGLLIVLSLMLAWFVSPVFLAMAAFVGIGLVFAGVSGWCGMARILGRMPWNRTST